MRCASTATTAEREAALGEALVFAANGVVTAEAKAAFEKAVALDASRVQASYFLGLAAEQDGNHTQAAAIWRALIAAAPADAPWIDSFNARSHASVARRARRRQSRSERRAGRGVVGSGRRSAQCDDRRNGRTSLRTAAK